MFHQTNVFCSIHFIAQKTQCIRNNFVSLLYQMNLPPVGIRSSIKIIINITSFYLSKNQEPAMSDQSVG